MNRTLVISVISVKTEITDEKGTERMTTMTESLTLYFDGVCYFCAAEIRRPRSGPTGRRSEVYRYSERGLRSRFAQRRCGSPRPETAWMDVFREMAGENRQHDFGRHTGESRLDGRTVACANVAAGVRAFYRQFANNHRQISSTLATDVSHSRVLLQKALKQAYDRQIRRARSLKLMELPLKAKADFIFFPENKTPNPVRAAVAIYWIAFFVFFIRFSLELRVLTSSTPKAAMITVFGVLFAVLIFEAFTIARLSYGKLWARNVVLFSTAFAIVTTVYSLFANGLHSEQNDLVGLISVAAETVAGLFLLTAKSTAWFKSKN
jgi:hypothetical protein